MHKINVVYDAKLLTYKATVNDNPEWFEIGNSIPEAIGKAVQAYDGELGIELTFN